MDIWSGLGGTVCGYHRFIRLRHRPVHAGDIPVAVLAPFVLNVVFNLAFTPIQFGLRNYLLALIDIILILVTLVWALVAIWPYARWVSLVNLGYLGWVGFATLLQLTMTRLNWPI